ncbi:MAG: pitrilysin family protein [Candidatus Paceibacterota bacterium]
MQQRYEWKLKNGLEVIYNHYPQAASFAVNAIGKAGSMYEQKHPGIAHFLEHVVLDATKKYPDEESLSRVITDVGGASNGGTNRDYVTFYAVTLAKDAERAFDHVSEVTIHPLIHNKSVGKQKKIISEEIKMYATDPSSFAYDRSVELLYPDSRVGGLITGALEDISILKQEDLRDFHSQLYTSSRFILSLCGPLPPEEVKKLAEEYFSAMPSGNEEKDTEAVPHDAEFNIEVANWQDVSHAHIYFQYHAPEIEDDRMYATKMMGDILGGHELSRLFVSIREKHGLSYHISSHHNPSHRYGYITVYAGISDENIEKFLKLYTQETQRIVEGGVSEEEFKRTRNRVLASFLFKSDSPKSTAAQYGYNRLFAPEVYTFEDIAERYRQVTREDIQKAAQDILTQPPKISVVSKGLSEESFRSVFN